MTKAKKLIARAASIAASAVFCAAAITSIPASAIFGDIDQSSEEYQELMDSVYEVDDSGFFSNIFNGTYKIYVSKLSQSQYNFIALENCPPQFEFTMTGLSEDEAVQSILDSFDPGYKVSSIITSDGNTRYAVTDESFDSETIKNARAVCEELKQKGLIQNFYYYSDIAERTDLECDYITQYTVEDAETVSNVEKYVQEKGLDCDVVEINSTKYRVVPDSEMTPEDYLALAQQIYDDWGLSGIIMIPETTYSPYATTVDMFNAVYGDATNDSNIDLYDAIEISKGIMGMRTFNDKEKIIADYDGNGEIDLYDAIGIAKYIMNIE